MNIHEYQPRVRSQCNSFYSILGMFIRVQGLPKILCCEGIPSSPSGGEASEVLQWLTWRYRWDDCGKNRITVSHFDIMVICPSNGGPNCMFSSLSFQMDGVLRDISDRTASVYPTLCFLILYFSTGAEKNARKIRWSLGGSIPKT